MEIKKHLEQFLYLSTMVNNTEIKSIDDFETPSTLSATLILDKKVRKLFFDLFISEVFKDISKKQKSEIGRNFQKMLIEFHDTYDEKAYKEYQDKFIKKHS